MQIKRLIIILGLVHAISPAQQERTPSAALSAPAAPAIEDGQVYKEQSSPPFYLIKGGKKLWIPNFNVLANLGFTTSQVRIVADGRLAGISNLPNLAGPVLDALNIPLNDGKVKPSQVFFTPPPGIYPINHQDTHKEAASIVLHNFYIAGWLLPDDEGKGPFAHCMYSGASNPLCIEDYLYEVQIDMDFLRQMYGPEGLIRIPDTVVLPGDPAVGAKRLPFVNVDAAGGVSPNSLTLCCGDAQVKLHVELNSWHVKSTGYLFYANWTGLGQAPAGWIHWDGDKAGPDKVTDARAAQAENWWPFPPYDPDNRGTRLELGQYVIMRGTIWQDAGHDDDANGNSEMDKIGLTGQGAWLEMHPPDAIIRSRPSSSCSDPLGHCVNKIAFRIAHLNQPDQFVTDETIEIPVPDKPAGANPGDSFRIHYEEYVDTRFTTATLVTVKSVQAQADKLQVHLRLQNSGAQRAMFKATYVVWWELEPKPDLPPARITVSPLSFDFGQQTLDVPSTPRVAMVVNSGGTSGAITASVTEPFWQRSDCPSTLAPGASCTVSITFTPTQAGSRSSVLSLGASLPQVLLTGVGYDPPRSGVLTTDDAADRLNWTYQPGIGPRDSVTFQLCLAPDRDWWKSISVLNGNQTLVKLSVQGKNSQCASQVVPVTALSTASVLEFYKAKFLGLPARVKQRALSEFMPLRAGTLSFSWVKD